MRDIYIDFRSYEDFMNLFHMDIEKVILLSIIINFPKMKRYQKLRNTIVTAIIHELNTEIVKTKETNN